MPTQLAYPLRAVVRTIVASLIGALLAWLARQGVTVAEPGLEVALVDLVASVVWVAGTAVGTWLLTIPAVAAVLSETALAPSPDVYVPERAAGGAPTDEAV